MANDKYVKIDPLTGNPDYIDKDDGQKIAGVPSDDDLCFIKINNIQITKAVVDNAGGKIAVDVPGFAFECIPSDGCKKKNKDANEKKKKLQDEIKAEKAIIDAQDQIINDAKQKAQHAGATKKKKEAEKKKADLQAELDKFKRHDCVLKYFVGVGGDDKTGNGRHTPDEIKDKKIENVVCLCQRIEPDPPKKPQPPKK